MVDTNQEPVEKKEPAEKKAPVKKKKESPKRTMTKTDKGEDKAVVKKLPVKKENAPAKGQGSAKAPAKAPAAQARKLSVANIKKFVKGAWSELKKVHWPNRREIVTFTGVVLVAVALVAVMLFAVDSILGKILEVIIPK